MAPSYCWICHSWPTDFHPFVLTALCCQAVTLTCLCVLMMNHSFRSVSGLTSSLAAETLSTLKFANRAKNIRNAATVNEDIDQRTLLRKYERELRRLRTELQRRQQELVDKRHLLAVLLFSYMLPRRQLLSGSLSTVISFFPVHFLGAHLGP